MVVEESRSVPAWSQLTWPGRAGKTGRGYAGRAGSAMVTGRLSREELSRLLDHTSALLEKRWLLPAELYIKLDTFRADLLAEQEDRLVRGS